MCLSIWFACYKRNYNPVRHKFIKEQVEVIKKSKPTEFINISPFYESFSKINPPSGYLYVIRDKTAIKCEDGSWIYFLVHSSHENKLGEKYQIGDVTLAIDNHGYIYANYNHVCGVLNFRRKGPNDYYKNSSDFFSWSWKRLN